MTHMTRADTIHVADYAARNPLAGIADEHYTGQEWRLQAACLGTGWEFHFPPASGSSREAKAICARCLVQDECLEYALDTDQKYGIWAGVGPKKLAQIRRQRRQQEKGAA